jgi:hypothetical protein
LTLTGFRLFSVSWKSSPSSKYSRLRQALSRCPVVPVAKLQNIVLRQLSLVFLQDLFRLLDRLAHFFFRARDQPVEILVQENRVVEFLQGGDQFPREAGQRRFLRLQAFFSRLDVGLELAEGVQGLVDLDLQPGEGRQTIKQIRPIAGRIGRVALGFGNQTCDLEIAHTGQPARLRLSELGLRLVDDGPLFPELRAHLQPDREDVLQ